MLARIASLRLWLLVAMLASAAVGLVAAVILFGRVQDAHQTTADVAKARAVAGAIADQVAAGADVEQLRALQAVLMNDQITVVRGGRTVFRGAVAPGRSFELSEQAAFPGGFVRLTDYSSPDTSTTLDLVLIMGGVLALVIAAAVATATLITRAVQGPVHRAINAADRVSHGELSARMGSSGPEELVRLGRAFDDMAARLERADRDQRQFLADVAHEIATPINTVSGFAMALADGAAEDPEQRDEARMLIETETVRLRDLLTDLRRLTHLDLAEGVRLEPLALRPFAERLAARVRGAASQAGVELSVSARPAMVMTDARLVEMIASNLLSNAVRYTPAGGRVELRLRHQRGKLVLSVRDTGVGIAPEHQQRIFDRLYRVDSTRDRATGGLGLGLAIASRAAQNLGGHIELETAPGKGSEFRLLVPATLTPGQSSARLSFPRVGEQLGE